MTVWFYLIRVKGSGILFWLKVLLLLFIIFEPIVSNADHLSILDSAGNKYAFLQLESGANADLRVFLRKADQGASFAGASIQLENLEASDSVISKQTLFCDLQGQCIFPSLTAGNYRIIVDGSSLKVANVLLMRNVPRQGQGVKH